MKNKSMQFIFLQTFRFAVALWLVDIMNQIYYCIMIEKTKFKSQYTCRNLPQHENILKHTHLYVYNGDKNDENSNIQIDIKQPGKVEYSKNPKKNKLEQQQMALRKLLK